MKINPLNCIDFYKAGHRQQYPAGTTLVVSNLTPRSARHANVSDRDSIVFFGLQYFIKEFLIGGFDKGFFSLPKADVVGDYKQRMDTSLGKDSIPVDHIAALHDLGYLPIEIKALPEGTLVPIGMPCMTIHNTHPDFFWLTNYLETVLSAYLWLPCTSATTAYNYRKLIDRYSALTDSPAWFSDFQAHDFSFRGMSSLQSAIISGAAHLLFFKGTDTVPAIDFLEQYYDADSSKEMVGGSVPATEHSVMCMGGDDHELDTFRRLIVEVYPKGIVSIVSDTWDFWNVITSTALTLHQEIMSREGKVVFRPDSGDPVKIICGEAYKLSDTVEIDVPHKYKMWEAGFRTFQHRGVFYSMDMVGKDIDVVEIEPTPALKGAVECLWEIFGGTTTEQGFKLLDEHVGLIYGDSITYDRAEKILLGLKAKGFASANIVFGVGSYTYQYVTRDTWGWAVKATFGRVNGEDRNIYKCPKTDDGSKKSAKGLLTMQKLDGKLCMMQGVNWEEFMDESNLMASVFRDGKLLKEFTLAELRGTRA